jgi:hypothetical protein
MRQEAGGWWPGVGGYVHKHHSTATLCAVDIGVETRNSTSCWRYIHVRNTKRSHELQYRRAP